MPLVRLCSLHALSAFARSNRPLLLFPRQYNYYGTACFHHQDVIEATKVAIKAVLDEYPKLSGIALDMFGYPNYRDCVCDESERQLAAYRKQHPDQSEVVARETFSRDTLVEFQNEICRYARQLRPDIKSTVHVWPTYLPEPVYGNRLDLDYCCQTAAWFMLPYWSDEKVTQHARHIVEDARQYHRRQTGVPFVGLFVGKPGCDKSAERFEHELRTIFTATASRSLSVYDFANIAKRPTYKAAVKRVWSDCGVKVSDKRNTLR